MIASGALCGLFIDLLLRLHHSDDTIGLSDPFILLGFLNAVYLK